MYSWRVPPTITGSLTATAAYPGTDAEPATSTIRWHWAYAFLRIYAWLGLLALLLIRQNRSSKAAVVFIAAAVSAGIALALPVPGMLVPLNLRLTIPLAMTAGMLASYARPGRKRPSLVHAIQVTLLAVIVFLVFTTWPLSSPFIFIVNFVLTLIFLVQLLLAAAIVKRLSRSGISVWRMAAASLIASFAVNLLAMAGIFAATSPPAHVLYAMPTAAIRFALTMTLTLLPFILLVRFNSLYRERFMSVFRIAAHPVAVRASEPAQEAPPPATV